MWCLGVAGGLRLLQAALHRFFRHCRVREIDLHDRGFTARYHTTIPRQVGLAGSSAIITAFIRAVLVHYGAYHQRAHAHAAMCRTCARKMTDAWLSLGGADRLQGSARRSVPLRSACRATSCRRSCWRSRARSSASPVSLLGVGSWSLFLPPSCGRQPHRIDQRALPLARGVRCLIRGRILLLVPLQPASKTASFSRTRASSTWTSTPTRSRRAATARESP